MTHLNITHFPKFTVPGKNLSWIPEFEWNHEQNQYFIKHYRQNYSSAEQFRSRRRQTSLRSHSLIKNTSTSLHFVIQDESLLGHCTVHIYAGSYTNVYFTPHICTGIDTKSIEIILGSFITYLFATTAADFIHCLAKPDSISAQVFKNWPSENKEVLGFSNLAGPTRLTPQCIDLSKYCIEKSSWKKADPSYTKQPELAYLKRRAERLNKSREHDCDCKPRKRKRSFLSRLFKPTVDDPLF